MGLQGTFKSVSEHLGRLTPTAKLLIGSLMVILFMTLMLVGLYAGRASLVPLGLSPSLSPEARTAALQYLSVRDIPFEEDGSDVLVPPDDKYDVLWQLTENQLIAPEQIDFSTLIEDDSPFRSRSQSRMRYRVAKMNVLENMIAMSPGIDRAEVVLDEPEGSPGFGTSMIAPTASVTVVPTQGELSQAQVDAIARLVSGAHAGLKMSAVEVINARTLVAYRPRDDADMTYDQHLDVQAATETRVKQRLTEALDYIAGVRISVNVMVDMRRTNSTETSYEEPKLGEVHNSSRSINSNSQSTPAEPGVGANTGVDLGGAGGRVTTLLDDSSESASIPVFGGSEAQIEDTGGYPRKINASIGVPRSYFLRVFQAQQGDPEAEPDVAAFQQIVLDETARIRAFVLPLVDTEANPGSSPGTVTVDLIEDFAIVPAAGGGGSVGGAGVTEGLLGGGLVKYVSLGGLAFISLVTMFLMVRKATASEPLPTAQELAGVPGTLDAVSELLGEAAEAGQILEAQEVDEEVLGRRQLLQQINEMVNASPGDSAMLLRRWMQREV